MPNFDHDHPKNFNFSESASSSEKSAQFIVAIQQILESHDLRVATLTFDHANPTISYQLLAIAIKKSVYYINCFMRYSQFQSSVTRVTTPIFDQTQPNIFLSTLNFLYQHAKKQAISSVCSRDILDIKILQSDCQDFFSLI